MALGAPITGPHGAAPPAKSKPKRVPKPKSNIFDKMNQPFDRQTNLAGMKPKQIQRLLRAKGYDVVVDGKLSPVTREAMNAYIKGKSPKQFNDYAARKYHSVVSKGADPHVVASGGAGVVSGAGGSHPPRPAKPPAKGGGIDLGGIDALGGGADIGTDMPETSADHIAGLQFDAQINQAQRAIEQAAVQDPQNLHDIEHWYGQVLGSERTAAGRDTEISGAGKTSVGDAVAKIVASLGGSANEGAGLVGAAGADAVGMLSALGANQDQYNQDIQPLIQAESAGARARELASQHERSTERAGQLSDLRGQRGAASAAALLEIRDKNNALAQQRFQNKLALEQAREAAALSGLKIKGKAAAPGKGSFAGTSANQKLGIMQTAVQTIAGPDGKLRVDIPRAVQLVNNIIAGAGWDRHNPAVLNYRNQILMSAGITPQASWK
jgi:peptidoglycan hydrolase-like protein with peptidoglycan-binding domain